MFLIILNGKMKLQIDKITNFRNNDKKPTKVIYKILLSWMKLPYDAMDLKFSVFYSCKHGKLVKVCQMQIIFHFPFWFVTRFQRYKTFYVRSLLIFVIR